MKFDKYIDSGLIRATCIRNVSGFLTKGKRYRLNVFLNTTDIYDTDSPGNVSGQTSELGEYFTIGCTLHKNIKIL